jgi:hypothetical protein
MSSSTAWSRLGPSFDRAELGIPGGAGSVGCLTEPGSTFGSDASGTPGKDPDNSVFITCFVFFFLFFVHRLLFIG